MKKIVILIVFFSVITVAAIYIEYTRTDDAFDKNFLNYFENIANDIDLSISPQNEAASSTKSIEIPILVYHSVVDYPPSQFKKFTKITVPPTMFEKQMRFLADNHYNVVEFQSLLDYFAGKLSSLPANPVIITLDDGWESQYLYALPILERYHYTATFFIFTNAIGHKHFMTWEQIQNLNTKHMTIGGHTKTHPYLIKISDNNTLRDEIAGGKKIIEDHLGKSINIFAYPFGHYSDKIVRAVKEAGYQGARSTYLGSHQTTNNLFALKGILVTNNFEDFVSNLKK